MYNKKSVIKKYFIDKILSLDFNIDRSRKNY